MIEYILYGIEQDNSKFIFKRTKSLEEIDNFTMCFYNEKDLEEVLNELNSSNIKLKIIFLVKKDKYKEISLPIRYREDMYDEISVIDTYRRYLWLNPKVIINTNIKHVNLEFMREFKETGKRNFNESEFNMAIRAYFYREGKIVYTKVREAYFELLQLGQKVKCKKR